MCIRDRNQTACANCTPGHFSAELATTECKECASGEYTNASSLSVCAVCPRGYRCADPSGAPVACPPGTYAAAERMTACEDCSPGRYNERSARPGCKVCPVGFRCDSTGFADCQQGTFRNNDDSLVGASPADCAACNLTSSCPCDCAGEGTSTCDAGSSECLACTPGQFNVEPRQSTCQLCGIGSECHGGSALEQPCVYGKFAIEAGQSLCEACAPGRFSEGRGRANCTLCAPGHFCAGRRLNFTQLKCPRGKHQPEPEQGRCTQCVVGRFEPLLGSPALECAECSESTADDDDGQFKCACSADYVMHVDDPEFYEFGFTLDTYSAAVRCFQEPTTSACAGLVADPVANLTIAAASGDCPFDDAFVCRQILTLAQTVDEDPTEQRLDRVSASLIDDTATRCLRCPTDGSDCPQGTEFLDARVHTNAFQAVSGYWQDEDIYFDRAADGASRKVLPPCAVQGTCSGGWPVLQSCFSESCASGAWSACDGLNAGILCRSCVDSPFCVDGAMVLNGNNASANSQYMSARTESADYAYPTDGNYFCSTSSSLVEVYRAPLFKKTGYNCTSCGEPDDQVALKLGLGVGSVAVFISVTVGVAFATRRRWWRRAKIALRTARSGVRRRSTKGQTPSKLMLVFSYLQIQAMLFRPDTLETDFGELERSMRWMKFANLDVTYAAGCSLLGNFAFNFFVYTLAPLVAVGFLFVLRLLLWRCYTASKNHKAQEAWPYISAHLASAMLVLLYIVYTPASRAVISAFDCIEFAAEEPRTADGLLFNGSFATHDEYVLSDEYTGVQRLRASNYDMICWSSPRHQMLFYAAAAATALYPVGIPVLFVVLLYRSRRATDDTCDEACAMCNVGELEDPASSFVPVFHEKHLKHELDAKDARAYLRHRFHMPNVDFDNLAFVQYSVFVRPYHPTKWPFEVAMMLHKLFLCCLILFITAGSPEQVAVGMTEVVLFAGGMALWGPHTARGEIMLFSLCQLSIFFTLLTAMFIKADFDNADLLLEMLFYTTLLPPLACVMMILWRPVRAGIKRLEIQGRCDCCLSDKKKAKSKLRRQQEKVAGASQIRKWIKTFDSIQRNGGQRAHLEYNAAYAAIDMIDDVEVLDDVASAGLGQRALQAVGLLKSPGESDDEDGSGDSNDDSETLRRRSKAQGETNGRSGDGNGDEPSTPLGDDASAALLTAGTPLVALYDFREQRPGTTLINFSKGDALIGFKMVRRF